ncbi:APC membrane recruitment protein 2 [Limanda limanda]|uniref:APC membrane recruitment protein 2 n=1 Tax=Limanda limanda TaxID=27771 RepID=UPI0029C80863|nr:APC membrane recruitment protein 2 [Limanda limanda]
MDPPPGESQPSGKIRKGFKLFGKRKSGNIFSIRSKGDGNNKSPVNKGKTTDGLSDTAAPDMEPESDKEKRHEVSQGEKEQAEEEPLGEDGVMAAAAARASISSASSAKSLSFLSLLRGGRRGMGDRRVHTVSQPVGRQRRGLKGLFGTVKFRSKDKEDKEDAPPSPLLMLSRANSVEIIKEDLTLTPKIQPRSLDSPESDSSEPITSATTPGREVPSSSETITPQVTAGNLNRTDEFVPQPRLVPGDNSLSSLLADISSLLTFDSISGGGDFMADVEAEWGKASNAISAPVSEVTPSSASFFSKPTISSPLTSTSVSTAATAKPCFPTTASSQPFSPLTKTAPSSSPIAKPSTIITTLTKSSTLTTPSAKLSSDSTAASSVAIKSTATPTATELSKTPVTFTSRSGPSMSSSSITIKSTQSSTPATPTAPLSTPATVVKAPSASPNLTSTASKLASELAAPSAPDSIPVSISKDPPLPSQTFQSKVFPALSPAPYPVSPLPSGTATWQSEAPSSAKMTGSGQVSPDCQLVSPSSTGILGAQTRPSKTEELHSESRTNLQGPSREKKSPQVKALVLSKIPVVGGGRAGKLPVRESQHFDDEASRDPPTPEYEKPHFNSHDAARSKDKISDIEANVPALKHTLEENQQPPQPKVPTSVQRDSKIPVKHGATASQIPQAKEPPRSKIPTSKVPVRRVGNKPGKNSRSSINKCSDQIYIPHLSLDVM